MRKSNYDKFPATPTEGRLWKGWEAILTQWAAVRAEQGEARQVWVVECYQGVHMESLRVALERLAPDRLIESDTLFKSAEEIERMTYPYVTDDRLFGYRARFTYADFFDQERLAACRKALKEEQGWTILFGHGAAEVVDEPSLLVYVDMARWDVHRMNKRMDQVFDKLGIERQSYGGGNRNFGTNNFLSGASSTSKNYDDFVGNLLDEE